MEIFRNKSQLTAYVERNREMGKVVGFAPTMGALHDGHISLYAAAAEENDLVISSIFVNPTQFNNPEDLIKYPRTVDADLKKLEKSGFVHAVYLPEAQDIYPGGVESKHYSFDGLEDQMEGASRPGHFDGVGTVVEELLRQVQPDNAYFGEKDYQQLAIVRKLVKLKNLPVNIKGIPTQRHESGLAMSSRNARLTDAQRDAAKIIYDTLLKVNDWFRVISVSEINSRVTEIFNNTPGMVMEYFMIVDEESLRETDFFYRDRSYRAFLVVFVGNVRLIDNMHLE